MEIQQIRYFVEVARSANFTRAAEACNVSQPALTRAIKKLEDEMGGPLFHREGRRTHLTALGRLVRPRLEQALALTELARFEAIDFSELRGVQLDLGLMCTIAPSSVISLVEFLNRQAPHVGIAIHEASGRDLTRRILDGQLDVAIVSLPEVMDDLHAIELFEEDYVVAFPKGHRFEDLDAVPIGQLRGERYLQRVNCEYLDVLDAAGLDASKLVDVRFRSEHESWVRALVVAGLGCAIMPRSLSIQPELQSRKLIDPEITRTISVVTRRGRPHSPIVSLFVDICRKICWKAAR